MFYFNITRSSILLIKKKNKKNPTSKTKANKTIILVDPESVIIYTKKIYLFPCSTLICYIYCHDVYFSCLFW